MKGKERWKKVKGFEGYYEISNRGRLRSVKRKVKRGSGFYHVPERIIKLWIGSVGYYQASLCKPGVKKTERIHRLVATHFHKNPENKPDVNHIDFDLLNNNDWNLEWVTTLENFQHSEKSGRIYHHCNSKPLLCYDLKGAFIKKYISIKSAEKDGFDRKTILVRIKKNLPYKGYIFKYA